MAATRPMATASTQFSRSQLRACSYLTTLYALSLLAIDEPSSALIFQRRGHRHRSTSTEHVCVCVSSWLASADLAARCYYKRFIIVVCRVAREWLCWWMCEVPVVVLGLWQCDG
eukprot:scaffold225692_cov31-Tisochrysis_lutea.AAC.1